MGETGITEAAHLDEIRTLRQKNADLEARNLALNESIGKQYYDIHEHEMTLKVLWKKVFELQRANDNLRGRNEELVDRLEAVGERA